MGNLVAADVPWDSAKAHGAGLQGEWQITDVTSENLFLFVDYTEYTIKIRRRTTYYVVMMVLPLVLTSYLNVLVFLLPPDFGDKTSYLVTVTISLSVFSSFFNSDMPRGLTSIPKIFNLYLFVMLGGFTQLFVTMLIIRKSKAEQENNIAIPKPTVSELSTSNNKINPLFYDKEDNNITKVQPKEVSVNRGVTSCLNNWPAAKMELACFWIFLIVNSIGNTIFLNDLIG